MTTWINGSKSVGACTLEERAAIGIPEGLVHYSLGIEDASAGVSIIAPIRGNSRMPIPAANKELREFFV
jgi:hypothetical protein